MLNGKEDTHMTKSKGTPLIRVDIPHSFWTHADLSGVLKSAMAEHDASPEGRMYSKSVGTILDAHESREQMLTLPKESSGAPDKVAFYLKSKLGEIQHMRMRTLLAAVTHLCTDTLSFDGCAEKLETQGWEDDKDAPVIKVKYRCSSADGSCEFCVTYMLDVRSKTIASIDATITFPETALTDSGERFLRKFEGDNPRHFVIGASSASSWRDELFALFASLEKKVMKLDEIAQKENDEGLMEIVSKLMKLELLERRIRGVFFDGYGFCFRPPEFLDKEEITKFMRTHYRPAYIIVDSKLIFYDGLGSIETVSSDPSILAKVKAVLPQVSDIGEEPVELSNTQFLELINITGHKLEGGVPLKEPSKLWPRRYTESGMDLIGSVIPYLKELDEVLGEQLRVQSPVLQHANEMEERLLAHAKDETKPDVGETEIKELQERTQPLKKELEKSRARSKFTQYVIRVFNALLSLFKRLDKADLPSVESALAGEGYIGTSSETLAELTKEGGLLLEQQQSRTKPKGYRVDENGIYEISSGRLPKLNPRS